MEGGGGIIGDVNIVSTLFMLSFVQIAFEGICTVPARGSLFVACC